MRPSPACSMQPGSSQPRRASKRRRLDVGDSLRLSANYAYLKATQPDATAEQQVTETRRPEA